MWIDDFWPVLALLTKRGGYAKMSEISKYWQYRRLEGMAQIDAQSMILSCKDQMGSNEVTWDHMSFVPKMFTIWDLVDICKFVDLRKFPISRPHQWESDVHQMFFRKSILHQKSIISPYQVGPGICDLWTQKVVWSWEIHFSGWIRSRVNLMSTKTSQR